MTRITFFRKSGAFYGFREEGHADYSTAGDDILCSALSAMTMLIVNAIEVTYAARVDYEIDEDTATIAVWAYGALPAYEEDSAKRFAVSGLVEAYYYQLNDMLEDYYNYLDVEVRDDEE